MVEPTGYTALDLIGFTDRGLYDPDANYVKNDLTHVGNSTWCCKIDDTTGITPTEGANWTIFIESATSLAGMSDVDLNTPKAGDGLVHDGNDWTNVPIMTKEQWKKNGAYNHLPFPYSETSQVRDGTTFEVVPNGKIIVSGVPSNPPDFSYLRLVSVADSMAFASKYADTSVKFCLCSSSATGLSLKVEGLDASNNTVFTQTGIQEGTVINIPSNVVKWEVLLVVANTFSGASTIVTPMLTTDLNATYDDYEPYAKTNRQLTEDTTSMNGSATKNGLTFTWAILAKNLLIITISSGSATNAMSSGTHLLDLSDIGLSGRSFLMASQSLYSYPASAGRFSVAANYAYVETNDTVSSGASLRGTIVCVLK